MNYEQKSLQRCSVGDSVGIDSFKTGSANKVRGKLRSWIVCLIVAAIVTSAAATHTVGQSQADILIKVAKAAEAARKKNKQHSRPVYIVAHRCNGKNMITPVVRDHGVNAIEADFMYNKNTKDWRVIHDTMTNNAPKLAPWLAAVKNETGRSGSVLSLLHVDIKSPDAPLDVLYDQIRAALPKLYLLFDIGNVKYGVHLSKIKSRILRDHYAAVAMGFSDSPTDVNAFFKRNGWPMHKYWYEAGLTAALPWGETAKQWTRDAIKARNAGLGPKVIIWTFEKKSSVKYWLDQGVDAILVNSSKAYGRTTAFASDAPVHVETAKAMVSTKYGTPSDNPLKIVRDRTYDVFVRTGTRTGAGTDSNIYITIYGPKGNTGEHRLNGLISGNAFENGDGDSVRLERLKDVGKPTKVRVRSDGTYAGAAWDLAYIAIDGRPARFYKWIQKGSLSAEAPVVDK